MARLLSSFLALLQLDHAFAWTLSATCVLIWAVVGLYLAVALAAPELLWPLTSVSVVGVGAMLLGVGAVELRTYTAQPELATDRGPVLHIRICARCMWPVPLDEEGAFIKHDNRRNGWSCKGSGERPGEQP